MRAIERVVPEQWYATWPPDDTEQSILGSDWHQLTITNLRLGINEIARAEAGPGRPVPFQAVSQATLLGLRRRGKTAIRAMPDVFIFTKPMDGRRLSFSALRDGPPAVAIEVASESTFEQDSDFEAGKGWIYAAAGIAEYLTIDTSGFLQEAPLRAWTLHDGTYVEGMLDPDGIWWSQAISVGIAVRDGMVVVYDHARRPQVRESEVGAELARRDASGLMQGRRQALIRVLQRRFGAPAEDLAARLAALDDQAVLDTLLDAAVDARSLTEFEKQVP